VLLVVLLLQTGHGRVLETISEFIRYFQEP